MKHFLLWRFCHEDSVKASLLRFVFSRRSREHERDYFVKALCHVLPVCLPIVLLNVLLGAGFAGGTFADRTHGNMENGGSTDWDGNIESSDSADWDGNIDSVGGTVWDGNIDSVGGTVWDGNIKCDGSTVLDGNIKCDGNTDWNESRGKETKEAETLFITICDTDGVKRLLSSEHPAVLTQGLYFSFPKDVQECEISQNDGAWIKTAERVYLDPKQTEAMVIRVRFRAKGSDGSLRYSKSFVLIGSG